MIVRRLEGADLDKVMALDAQTNPTPWLRSHWQHAIANNLCLGVQSASNELAGFAVAQHVLDEAELLLIAIHPDQQRQGLGTTLLQALMRALADAGASMLFLEVRAGNRPAHQLYECVGGCETGTRPRYYRTADGGREDALLYTIPLERSA
ncbi:ribosomal protein S18-alanine N-acetyltransferase [Chitinibacteraceae bacterium HSL-7]